MYSGLWQMQLHSVLCSFRRRILKNIPRAVYLGTPNGTAISLPILAKTWGNILQPMGT